MQTLHEHSLAYVKQNLPAAKSSKACLLICVCLFAAACAKLPRTAQTLEPTPATHNEVRININTAGARELENLPGIGETMAARIVAHRERYGAFRRAEHLMMVRGISDKKFRALQPLITVN